MVTPGGPYGTKRIVTKGLKQGEKMVAVGVQKVKSGKEVKPVAPAEPGKDEPAQAAKPADEQ